MDLAVLAIVFYQLATRAQALAMKAIGAILEHIQSITLIKRRALQYLFKKVINCGWNPTTNPLIINGYVVNGPRPGRKPKVTYNPYGPLLSALCIKKVRIL